MGHRHKRVWLAEVLTSRLKDVLRFVCLFSIDQKTEAI